MKIRDILKPESILLHTSVRDKADAIDTLVDLQEKGGHLTDKDKYREAILAREAQTSTAIEMGIAVPHAKTSAVTSPGLAAMTLDEGIDYESMDGQPSDLFFMIAAPEGGEEHLQILSHMMVMLMDPDFCGKLRVAQTPEEFLSVINAFEAEKYPDEPEEETGADTADAAGEEDRIRVLAVTACPTGIAHTYMAAEALEKSAEAKGIKIKVETNGSDGVKHQLTPEEIEACDGIIVAADKKVNTARFDGKKCIITKVADGIHKPDEMIDRILAGDAPVHHEAGGASAAEQTEEKESAGRQFYKHLMNGVSHMLPFVVGGGILIALSFLLDNRAIDPSHFGSNLPIAHMFNVIGNAAFGLMLPVLAGFIAMSIADRPGLAVGFVGGMLAKVGNSFWDFDGKAGISAGFLGAMVAGFLAGYIVLLLKRSTAKMPQSMQGLRPILIYPLAGIFIMGVVMLLINPVMGAINTGISNLLNSMSGVSIVLLGAVCAAMMAVDMGGPINKAAYLFGTGMLASGNYKVMAAVMIGGMVPPIAIALCATFFPKKFTKGERQSGIINYVMGLCFITEGAIPFAAADPARVIPASVAGAAVSGGLAMKFGCTLQAPHGGIFVFPVVGNVGGYLIALAAGSIVGMFVLAVLKKNKTAEEMEAAGTAAGLKLE
ncbi:MAG: PTS fructose transporter subunit IIABC [Eubacterium sp.]